MDQPTKHQLWTAKAHLMLATLYEQQRDESAAHREIIKAANLLGVETDGDPYVVWSSVRAIIQIQSVK